MKTLFGIKNCDTVKKAVQFLTEKSISYSFHNFKVDGIDEMTLKAWCRQVGWEKLVNKKSATWRSLTPEIQNTFVSEDGAISVLLSHTSLIKRPVLVENGTVLSVGFEEIEYQKLLQ